MGRQARDQAYARAFSERLRQVVQQLDVPVLWLGRQLGYRDGSTLHAALAGRCVLDIERLAQLASLCELRGQSMDLHWLLTGHALQGKQNSHAEWLTPKRLAALRTLAEAVSELPDPALKRKRATDRNRHDRTT